MKQFLHSVMIHPVCTHIYECIYDLYVTITADKYYNAYMITACIYDSIIFMTTACIYDDCTYIYCL